jgi:L-lactate dehydrogenase complex protein LldE
MGVTEIGASFPHRVTYHDACHTLRELGIREEPRRLLAAVRGLTLVEMAGATECCGFGGTFSTKFPTISAAMGERKAEGAERAGVEFVTSTDPSCLLQIDGILRRRNSPVRAIHLASILAGGEAAGASSAKGT